MPADSCQIQLGFADRRIELIDDPKRLSLGTPLLSSFGPPQVPGRPHPGVLKTAAVVVPQTWRVAGRPPISGENHHVASAVTAPEMEISLAQEQTTTCYTDSK
jgi:hypothetical protein